MLKDKVFQIRLTASQKEALFSKAKESNLTAGKYIIQYLRLGK